MNFIKHAKSAIFNSTSTVKHLLSLSRFQTQNLKVVYEDVDVGVLIQHLGDELHSEIIRKNISFENKILEDSILTVDKQIIIEISRNLILNAIKFCKEGDHIKIEYREEDSYQIVSFEDSGIGISNKVKNEIFKSEVSTIGTLGEKGFGIGLKLCNELMVLHKGKIEVESIEGLGSKFSLYFPTNRKTVLILGDSNYLDDLTIGLENSHCLPILESDASHAKTRMSEVNFLCMILLENKPIVLWKSNYKFKKNGSENIFYANNCSEIIGLLEKIPFESKAPI